MKTTTRCAVAIMAMFVAIVTALFVAGSASAAPGDPAPANYGGGQGVDVQNSQLPPGGSTVVSGQNCTPNSSVSISLDNSTPLGSASTDSSGNYSTTITVPSGTSTGSHTVNVTGANCASVADISVVASGGGNSGGGGLADTGVAVIGIGALGVVLLVGGGLMLLAGRRRKITI